MWSDSTEPSLQNYCYKKRRLNLLTIRIPKMKNESSTDRIIRVIAAVVIFIIALFTTGIIQIVLYVLAAIMLFTAITGFCLLYKLLGINTDAM